MCPIFTVRILDCAVKEVGEMNGVVELQGEVGVLPCDTREKPQDDFTPIHPLSPHAGPVPTTETHPV